MEVKQRTIIQALAAHLSRALAGCALISAVWAPALHAEVSEQQLSRISASNFAQRGQLIFSARMATLTKAAIDQSVNAQSAQLAQLAGPAQCDVNVDLMVYISRGPRNEPITVSGVVLTPRASETCVVPTQAPVISYGRGTQTSRRSTLTDPQHEETGLLTAFFASKGYVVVASDSQGYFASTLRYHSYLHAQSEANASVDALRAARVLLRRSNLQIGKLFVTGYSQGGHTAMATHKALEENHRGEFPLLISAPMSGAYSLEETFLFGAKNFVPAGTVFGGFGVVGMNHAYRSIYKQPSDIFNAPYADKIESYFPGRHDANTLLSQGMLPQTIAELFTPQFLATLDEPQSPLRIALRANSLVNNWTPRAPMALCAGARDPMVPFFNTQRAQQAFQTRGATVNVLEVDQLFQLPPFGSQDEMLAYHGVTVIPLCFAAVRDAVFNPMK